MPKPILTDVECDHCGKNMVYDEPYLVASWMSMNHQDLEEHDEREATFCRKCAPLVILALRRHVKRA